MKAITWHVVCRFFCSFFSQTPPPSSPICNCVPSLDCQGRVIWTVLSQTAVKSKIRSSPLAAAAIRAFFCLRVAAVRVVWSYQNGKSANTPHCFIFFFTMPHWLHQSKLVSFNNSSHTSKAWNTWIHSSRKLSLPDIKSYKGRLEWCPFFNVCVLVWPYRCVDIGVVIVQGIERAPNTCEQLCSSTAFPSSNWRFVLFVNNLSHPNGFSHWVGAQYSIERLECASTYSQIRPPLFLWELPAASLLAPPIWFWVWGR